MKKMFAVMFVVAMALGACGKKQAPAAPTEPAATEGAKPAEGAAPAEGEKPAEGAPAEGGEAKPE